MGAAAAAILFCSATGTQPPSPTETQQDLWEWDGKGEWPPPEAAAAEFEVVLKLPLTRNPAASRELVGIIRHYREARFRAYFPGEDDNHWGMEKERWHGARLRAWRASLRSFAAKYPSSDSALNAKLVLAVLGSGKACPDLLKEIVSGFPGAAQATLAAECLSRYYIARLEANKAAQLFYANMAALAGLDQQMDEELRSVIRCLGLLGPPFGEYVRFQKAYMLACLGKREEAIAGFRSFLQEYTRPTRNELFEIATSEIWKYEHGLKFEYEGTDVK